MKNKISSTELQTSLENIKKILEESGSRTYRQEITQVAKLITQSAKEDEPTKMREAVANLEILIARVEHDLKFKMTTVETEMKGTQIFWSDEYEKAKDCGYKKDLKEGLEKILNDILTDHPEFRHEKMIKSRL